MAQGILSFKYAKEKNIEITALAGLPLYLDIAVGIRLSRSIQKHLKIKAEGQGWTDSQIVLSLILLNLAGGDCVEDLKILEADSGFCEILKRAEMHGLNLKARRDLAKRWRKDKTRSVPSASAVFRYLSDFHDPAQETMRNKKAFIPDLNEHLKGLELINKDICAALNAVNTVNTATLDMDATLVKTDKKEALFCYKGFKSYQPLNTWWSEHKTVLHTEFRDGNVPAGYEQLRVFKKALSLLPKEVKTVRLRSDTAGYQHDLLKYCERGSERFGKIEFAIGCNVASSFKRAAEQASEWKPMYKTVNGKKVRTGTEWAEVCFVPNAVCHSKNDPEYRYIAKRQILDAQMTLPGMEENRLPFQTVKMNGARYKIFGIVTNIEYNKMDGGEIINWLHERCGKSEEAHAVMKDDLAGGRLPSKDFGANAAWWWIMIMALNLNALLKSLALEPEMQKSRMKKFRFKLINIPGRIIKRSRSLLLRLSASHPSFDLLVTIRQRLRALLPVPAG